MVRTYNIQEGGTTIHSVLGSTTAIKASVNEQAASQRTKLQVAQESMSLNEYHNR